MKNLELLKEKYSRIAGDWNGEDEKFVSGGIVYTADEAENATDIVDAIERVEYLVNEAEAVPF